MATKSKVKRHNKTPRREELLRAIKEQVAVFAEEKRMEKEYPAGSCNAEDAWKEFFWRKVRAKQRLQRLARANI